MILWTSTNGRHDAKSAFQGGPFASVLAEGGKWFVVWWVGPKTRVSVPSAAKGKAWVERFSGRRLAELGRLAATPGSGPGGNAGGYRELTAEERARYDAFTASYVPPKRRKRMPR